MLSFFVRGDAGGLSAAGSADDFVIEPLSEVESAAQLLAESGVTTVNFFSSSASPPDSVSAGDAVATVVATLRERVRDVLRANPWAAGKVVRDRRHKHLQLVYPKAITDDILDRVFVVKTGEAAQAIHAAAPYDDLYQAILEAKAIIPAGKSCINQDILSTKITVVYPDEGATSFALVASMSHTIADGYTFYRVLGMLSSATPVEALNATRSVAIDPVKDAWSADDWKFITTNVGFIANLVWGFAFGAKAKCYAFYTDDAQITAIKGREKEEGTVPYVSTNDILVANHSVITKPRLQTMAVNFRGRVPGAEKKDAGNYEAVVVLDEASYNSPAAVRQALTAYEKDATTTGRAAALPSAWEAWTAKPLLGQLSNWASFFDEIQLGKEGASNWTQELHLPILSIGQMPFDCAVIFRPQAHTTAIMYVCTSPQYQSAAFWQEKSPVGASVSAAIFGG